MYLSKRHSLNWAIFQFNVQARGKKRQIGWFPASYVKLLTSSSNRSTPVSHRYADSPTMDPFAGSYIFIRLLAFSKDQFHRIMKYLTFWLFDQQRKSWHCILIRHKTRTSWVSKRGTLLLFCPRTKTRGGEAIWTAPPECFLATTCRRCVSRLYWISVYYSIRSWLVRFCMMSLSLCTLLLMLKIANIFAHSLVWIIFFLGCCSLLMVWHWSI